MNSQWNNHILSCKTELKKMSLLNPARLCLFHESSVVVKNFWFWMPLFNKKIITNRHLKFVGKIDDRYLFLFWLIMLMISPLNWGVGLCCFRWHVTYSSCWGNWQFEWCLENQRMNFIFLYEYKAFKCLSFIMKKYYFFLVQYYLTMSHL